MMVMMMKTMSMKVVIMRLLCSLNWVGWVGFSDPSIFLGWLEYSHPLLLNTDDTYNLESEGNEVDWLKTTEFDTV